MRRTLVTVLALSSALALAGCGSDTASESTDTVGAASPTATESMAPTASDSPVSGETMKPGAYLTLADYKSQMAAREGTKVVYFFHASWCPDCRATEKSIKADGVPAGLTIVKLDYDTETDLKKEYGITQQHTFVQVGADGEELATWTGTKSGADIKAKTV